MKPIPLAAPDGTIYTYACGECHNVQGGNFALPSARYSVAVTAEMAESYRSYAELCCLCLRCRKEPRPKRNPDYHLFIPEYCEACAPIAAREFDEAMKKAEAQATEYLQERGESLLGAKDAVIATKLFEVMTDLSEENWCAAWLSDLEYTLWSFVCELRTSGEFPTRRWGADIIERAQVLELSDLSLAAGGWWMWNLPRGTTSERGQGAIFVTAAVWATRADPGLDTG